MSERGPTSLLPLHGAGFELNTFEQHIVEAVDKAVANDDVAKLGLHHIFDRRVPQRDCRQVAFRVAFDRKQRTAANAIAFRKKQAVAIERNRLRAGCVRVAVLGPWMFPQHLAIARRGAHVTQLSLTTMICRSPATLRQPAKRNWPGVRRRSSGLHRFSRRTRRVRSRMVLFRWTRPLRYRQPASPTGCTDADDDHIVDHKRRAGFTPSRDRCAKFDGRVVCPKHVVRRGHRGS